MGNFIMGIIGLTIGVVMLASVFMTTVKAVTVNGTCLYGAATNATTGACQGYSFTAAEYALYGLLGIAGIAGMVYGVLNVFGLA